MEMDPQETIDIKDWDIGVDEPLKSPLLRIFQEALINSMTGPELAPDLEIWAEEDGPKLILWLRGFNDAHYTCSFDSLLQECLSDIVRLSASFPDPAHKQDARDAVRHLEQIEKSLKEGLEQIDYLKAYVNADIALSD